MQINSDDWSYIGEINGDGYNCHILTHRWEEINGEAKTMEVEKIDWYKVDKLPDNIISNIKWIMEFAKNFHQQGLNGQDKLRFGYFKYSN